MDRLPRFEPGDISFATKALGLIIGLALGWALLPVG